MSDDPYQPPTVTHHQPPCESTQESPTVPPLVTEHLRATRPWVRFCSLAGYITSGFLILFALITILKVLDKLPLYQTLMLGGFYLTLSSLFIIPSRYLSRYEKSINHLLVSQRLEDLEQALADQRAFWKQMGLIILVILILYLMTIAFSLVILLTRR